MDVRRLDLVIYRGEKMSLELRKQIATLITGAFGFVSAIVWKDAIMAWMAPLLESGSGAYMLTIVAFIVTIVAVIATYLVGRTLGR